MQASPDRFEFRNRHFDPATGEIELHYGLDDLALCERFFLPPGLTIPADRAIAIEHALDALHWIAGVSYFKTFCPPHWNAFERMPSAEQGDWLDQIYRQGLAEFAHRNGLNPDGFPKAPRSSKQAAPALASELCLKPRALLPLGGGKDSVVAWHRLSQVLMSADVMSVQVGSAPLIQELGEWMVAQGHVANHWVIGRTLDPHLAKLNRSGAMNGHVPMTAINAAVLTVFALVIDARWVVFANERSADEPTLWSEHGHAVNHQYSKSYAFEQLFDDWVRRYIASDLSVFSMLRSNRELAIAKTFAELSDFHGRCSSCNRNFHIDPKARTQKRWCGQCPKCQFVYLMLAVWLSPKDMRAMFGHDLLADADATQGFRALLALDGTKPFECVGEADEARAAVVALSRTTAWQHHPVVQALSAEIDPHTTPGIEDLLPPTGPNRVPSVFSS